MGIKSCCFDLETTNLNADFGRVLCAVIKPQSGKPIVFRGDECSDWENNRADDSELVSEIVSCLSDYDIWVAHNGAKFDVPFLRTRILRWDLDPLPSRKLVDPVLIARSKLKMTYNSLSQIADVLGCNSKTKVDPQQWLLASLNGCTKAMDYIVKHCVQDVKVLEQVVEKLKHYSTAYNTYGSGY